MLLECSQHRSTFRSVVPVSLPPIFQRVAVERRTAHKLSGDVDEMPDSPVPCQPSIKACRDYREISNMLIVCKFHIHPPTIIMINHDLTPRKC